MAITIEGQPNGPVNPAYNPVVYYIDSTNKSKDGFRYIAVVKDDNGNILFEKTLIPDIENQYGVLNLNRELSNYISYNLDFANLDGNVYDADKSYLNYELEFGEEFYESWDWDDFGFVAADGTGTISWANATNPAYNDGTSKTAIYTTISGNTAPSSYIGQSIFVSIPSVLDDAPIQGIVKVLDVFDNGGTGGIYWTVVLDINWIGSGSSNGGSTRFADNRKSRFSDLTDLQDQTVINTALSKKDWLSWDYNNYKVELGNSNINILSQLYDGYTVREDSNIFIQWLQYLVGGSKDAPSFIYFENDTQDTSLLIINAKNSNIVGIDLSPTRTDWGTVDSGTLPIVKSTTKWYQFTLLDKNEDSITKTYRIYIDRSCTLNNPINALFMDKLGSFLPWSFTFINEENHNVKSEKYTKQLGGFDGSKYTYDLIDGGSEVYNKEYSKSYLLRTGYLSDKEALFFQNFIHSPYVLIEVDGEYQRCVVDTNSFKLQDRNTQGLKRYEINVTMSNRESINI